MEARRYEAGLRRLGTLVVVAFLALGAGPLAAQTADRTGVNVLAPPSARKESAQRTNAYSIFRAAYWREYLEDGAKLLGSPLRWMVRDWFEATVVAAATAGYFALDDDIQEFWQDDIRGDSTDDVADVVRVFGGPVGIAGFVPGAFIAGGILKFGLGDRVAGERLQKTALLSAESVILTTGLVEGVKRLAGRKRPNASGDADDFTGPGTTHGSFPSGHAARAFAIATVVASEYHDNLLVRGGSYGLATLVALSRVNDDKHWASDVFLGAALGYYIGRFVYNDNPFDRTRRIRVVPVVTGNRAGLAIAYRF